MSPRVQALYTTVRLALLAFALAAVLQGQWSFVLAAVLIRTALWWVAVPHRKVRSTGITVRSHMIESRRASAREHGFADIALTVAKLPGWIGLPCRATMILPMRLAGDRTTNALLLYGRKSRGSLESILRSGRSEERESAARALAELKPEGYETILRPLLDDSIDSVRAVAEVVFGGRENLATSDPFLRLIRLPKREVVPADLVEALRAAIGQASQGEQRVIVHQLGERGGEEAKEWLMELLTSNDSLATFAGTALRKEEDPRVCDALLVRAQNTLGLMAIAELVRRKDVRVEPIVIEGMKGQGWSTRGLYIGYLAALPTESAQAAAREQAAKERGFARMLAADALAYQGGDQEMLVRCSRSFNPLVRLYARHSLKKLPPKPL